MNPNNVDNPSIPNAPAGAGLGNMEDPFEVAATMFGMYTFQLEKGVKTLEANQLKQLIMALVAQPLNPQDVSMELPVKDAYDRLKLLVTNKQTNVDALETCLNNLSMGELRRLINAIVQYPLANKDFIEGSSGKNLKDCFAIGARLMEAKTLMFIKTLSDYETSMMEKQASQEKQSSQENQVTEEKK